MILINWSNGVKIGLISLIPLILSVILTLTRYFKDRYPYLKYLAGMWISLTIWILFQAISDLLLNIYLHLICFYALIVLGYFAILFVDSVTRDSIDHLKLILMTISSTAVIIFSFSPEDAIRIETEAVTPYPTMVGDFRTAAIIHMVLVISVSVYGFIKIFIHTPEKLKKYSMVNVLGSYLWGIQPLFIQFTDMEKNTPGLSTASMAAGVLINAIIFLKEPKLAYVITFKAYRLLIQNTNTSIILFKHDWNELEAPESENIFSGNMQAISTIFDLSINKGNVKKIKFDEAEITFKASEKVPLACILISSDSSITLRSSFDKFADDVFRDYQNIEKNSHSTNKYENGTILLAKYFPFIP